MPGMLESIKAKVGQTLKAYGQWVSKGGTLPVDRELRAGGSYLGYNDHPDTVDMREKDVETTALMDAYRQMQAKKELEDEKRKLEAIGVLKAGTKTPP